MWYVHGHINFALVSGAALSDLYDGGDAAGRPDRVVPDPAGLPHPSGRRRARSVGPEPHRPRTARRCGRSSTRTIPATSPPSWPRSEEGRAFLDQLNKYLYDFGWRSDAVYDIADVPWRENPSIPLGNIARYINMDDSDDPMIQFERAVKLREELTAKIRAKLADDPEQLAKFEELYDAPQYAVPAHRGPRVLHRSDGCRVASHVRAAPSAMRSPATA